MTSLLLIELLTSCIASMTSSLLIRAGREFSLQPICLIDDDVIIRHHGIIPAPLALNTIPPTFCPSSTTIGNGDPSIGTPSILIAKKGKRIVNRKTSKKKKHRKVVTDPWTLFFLFSFLPLFFSAVLFARSLLGIFCFSLSLHSVGVLSFSVNFLPFSSSVASLASS